MEFANIMTSTLDWIAGQGSMFWAATGAVLLGLSLILTSGAMYYRKSRARTEPMLPPPAIVPSEPPAKPIADEIPDVEPDSRALSLLLARLRSAADMLEAYKASRAEIHSPPAESSLKETPQGVDYLFRTGTG